MLIHSQAQLKAILLPKIEQAVQKTQEQVYKVIDEFLQKYYSEYSPIYYHRTYQLLQSLVKSEIKSVGNGYTCEVYFDVGALSYKSSWSGQRTMENAGSGYHAKYPKEIEGTAIWDTPKSQLDAELIPMLLSNLKAAGIPIR